jgi:glycine cleavage system H lipoate-binding protein
MEPLHAELFATKGQEYLLVITYLVLLSGFWALLSGPDRERPSPRRTAPGRVRGWFSLPAHLHFHQGHTWAAREADGVLRVGMDEFSRRLLGSPSALRLPEVGAELRQGGIGWTVWVDGKPIEMLSPVDGEVMDVNAMALEDPGGALERPYDDGWLLKVRVNRVSCPLKNLLTGEVAQAWIRTAEERIRTRSWGELGVVLPDGGEPVDGMAKAVSPEDWDAFAREFLLATPC